MKKLTLAFLMSIGILGLLTLEFYFMMPPALRAQVNTFCASNLTCTITAAWTFGPTSNVSLKPATADAVLYVSASASANDSNDGLSVGTAKATISAALAALPTCQNIGFTNNGSPEVFTQTCGTILLASNGGTTSYTLSSTLSLTSIFVRIIGMGEQGVKINCTVNAACISWTNNTNTAGVPYSGDFGLYNITLNGNNGSAQSGIVGTDMAGFAMQNVRFANFAGASGTCATFQNDLNYISERMNFWNLSFENCTKQLAIGTTGGSPLLSFGHQNWQGLQFTLSNGQTAFAISGGANLYSSYISGVINTQAPGTNAYTAVSIAGASHIQGQFNFQVDNAGGGTVTPCSGCTPSNFQTYGFAANDVGLTFNDTPLSIGTTNLSELANSLTICQLVSGPGSACSATNKWQVTPDGSAALGLFNQGTEDYSFDNSTTNPGMFIGNYHIRDNGLVTNTVLAAGGVANGFLGVSLNATNGQYQSKKGTAGCTTGAAAGNNCASAITVTWPTSFADTNYSVSCSGQGTPTTSPSGPYVVSKANGSVVVNYFTITAAAASYPTVDCIAVHD